MVDERDGPAVGPRLAGPQLSVDFVNTVEWRLSANPVESLASYSDLVAWGAKAGVLSEAEARRLLDEAECRPSEATKARARAIALREALYRIFAAATGPDHVAAADLAILNAELGRALARARLAVQRCYHAVSGEEGPLTPDPSTAKQSRGVEGGVRVSRFAWELPGGEDDLGSVLWPVALSAAELLTSAELERVRVCEGEGCGWLFVDTSRNRSRRWCSMDSCGNRAKARRHYERTRHND